MPVDSFFVPKYRHHKGSGQAFVQVKGKRHYLGRFGSADSKQRYSRFVAELASSPTKATPAPTPVQAAGITVFELAAAYWEHCKAYYRKKDGTPSGWLDHIQLVLENHLGELYGETPAADFGPKSFKAIRQRLVDAGCSRPYVNKLMPIVTRCFKWGASEELIPPSVYHGLTAVEGLRKGRTAAREPAPILPVDDAVVDATLPYLPLVIADMVRFQRLTGCRPGEVCQLRPADIDQSGPVWQFRPESHKTEHHGRERVIYIGPKAQAVIKAYIGRDAAANCFSPADSEDARHAGLRAARKSKVQPSQRNRRKAHPRRTPATAYTKDSYARAIRRGVDKANRALQQQAEELQLDSPAVVPYWAPNRLRHTRATEVRKQFGLEAAQIVLGHAKADITQIYAERDASVAVEVMTKIG